MKHIYKMDLLYTIVLLATLMESQIRQVEAQTQCAEQRFCSECITAHNECAWCNDVEFTDTRCAMNTSMLTSKGCQEIKSPTINETKTQELDQEKCSQGNGTYECGVCKCRPGRSGEFCQCDNKEGDTVQQEAKCRKDNGTKVCEDQGTCKCGQCVCLRNYLGPYCECNNNMCIKPGSTEKCSNHGQCNCGRCLCKDDYDGQHCECPPKRNCKHPETGMECNGHGTCKCGKCECEPDYEGPTCGECPKCERCSKCRYRECVKCIVENEKQTAMINETAIPLACQLSCPNLLVTMVNKFNDPDPCGFIVSKKCIINYLVECSNDTVRLNIANKRGK
ncbi:integrin beta-6-like [Mya arenaria]|uniref:integrin beta-6-like n=1 Tax=Mya arenaria TaxID=6604 RepID=UPI0022E7539F|nr:integrin beta-6-like [Mya arenaria]